MTDVDRIKGHFSAIADCAGNLRRNYDPKRVVENDEATQYLRKQLDAIKNLLKSGSLDFHRMLASQMFRVPPEEVTPQQRDRAKLAAFRSLYDGSLIEPEQESLAASVLRLTDLCNKLEAENATLDQSLRACRAAEKILFERNKELQARWGHVDYLRERNAELGHDLNMADSHIEELQEDIARKNNALKLAHSNLVDVRRGYEEDLCNKLEVKNRELKQDLKTDEAYVEKLRQELDAAIRSNAWLRNRLNFKDESLRASRAAARLLKQELVTTEALLEAAERRVKRLRATCSKVMADVGVTELRASNVQLLKRNQGLEQDLKQAYNQVKGLQRTLEEMGLS